MKLNKLIKASLKVVRNSLSYSAYYNSELDSSFVFFESRNGEEIAGNVLRIVLKIRELYDNQYVLITAAKKANINSVKTTLKQYGLENVRVLIYGSVSYFKNLFRAKYLINDSTFPDPFIKKDGQVYLNTWHGTPFKHMGRFYTDELHKMDNVQRNLFMSDIILSPNPYFEQVMSTSFCLKSLYKGKFLRAGYPRNSVFLNESIRDSVKKRYDVEKKRVYAYLPTFRNYGPESELWVDTLITHLKALDELLRDDEVMFFKPHNFSRNHFVHLFERLKHIQEYPTDIETYEFLSVADVLVTDYSSVFYDFATSRRKIVRFIFDKNKYFDYRGFYDQPCDFPFPEVTTVQELVEELRLGKEYDDREFIDTFCLWDTPDSAQIVVTELLQTNSIGVEENLSKSILIYGGNLGFNGITSSLRNVLHLLSNDYLGYVCVSRKIMAKQRNNFSNISQNQDLIVISGSRNLTILEAIAYILFNKFGFNDSYTKKLLDRYYYREVKKCFCGMTFTAYFQFVGYDKDIIALFQRAVNNTIFVHSLMSGELRSGKNNQHKNTLYEAYRNYDKVAAVSDSIIEDIKTISGRGDNICLVENCFDAESVLLQSKNPIETQNTTEVIMSDNYVSIQDFIDKHDKIIITVGRFSPEKNHELLINAFEQLSQKKDKIGLVLIGGIGKSLEETSKRVKISPHATDVLMIVQISNPMPILKQADLFVLTSLYEAKPVVLYEAACLGVPSICTNTPGCKEFMEKYGGYLFEPSVDEALLAIELGLSGEVQPLKIDFEQENKEHMHAFLDLLS